VQRIDTDINFLFPVTQEPDHFERYFALSESNKPWGIQVTTLGYQFIRPGQAYPAGRHPESHHLNQKKGRTLQEFQMVYVFSGEGSFWSEESGKVQIDEGSLILLFKEVRHRYRPDAKTGWSEYWVGFDGDYADHLMGNLFNPKHPVVHCRKDPDLLQLFQECVRLSQHEHIGFQPIMTAKTLEILARVQARSNTSTDENRYAEAVRKACCLMSERIQDSFSSDSFAKEYGMSQTSFRRHFKRITGLAPNQYLLELRLRKAQSLVTSTNLPIYTIARECGFENTLYFSRFYKQRTGSAPSEQRV